MQSFELRTSQLLKRYRYIRSMTTNIENSATTKFCTFRIAKNRYGIPAEYVQEIVNLRPLTPVPLAHPAVAGLINLRGQIVSSIDMYKRLGISSLPDQKPSIDVVVFVHDESISMRVDRVSSVVELETSKIEAVPTTVDPGLSGLLKGVYKRSGEVLLLLNVDEVTKVAATLLQS